MRDTEGRSQQSDGRSKGNRQEHGPEAFKRLVKIIKSGTARRLAKGVLDRASGKSPQALVGDPIRLHNKIEFVIAARPKKGNQDSRIAFAWRNERVWEIFRKPRIHWRTSLERHATSKFFSKHPLKGVY